MRQAAGVACRERELHEYVAEVEGHDSQVTGVVGYFYAMYRAEVLARVGGVRGRDILEIGCGEGMMFDGTGIAPVQMDVSMTRVSRAAGEGPAAAVRRRLRAAVRRTHRSTSCCSSRCSSTRASRGACWPRRGAC